MSTTLHVIADLAPTCAARRLTLAVAPGDDVCVLAGESPWCAELRNRGVIVTTLGRGFAADPVALWSLRGLCRDRHVVAWGESAAWALVLSASVAPAQLTLVAPLVLSREPSSTFAWLLRRARRVVALGSTEAAACVSMGVDASRLRTVTAGVSVPEDVTPVRAAGVPEGARHVVTPGPFGLYKGQRESAWVFDIMVHPYPDLHLSLLGPGDVRFTRSFVETSGRTSRVFMPGYVADVFGYLASADIVWLPVTRSAGVQSALEAMALGRAIIASDVPAIAEIVEDGRTGILVPPGDKAALSRATRRLFESSALREDLGSAARESTRQRHDAARYADEVRDATGG